MSKLKETELQMMINNLTRNNYFDRLKMIAVSMFTWEGLDEIGGNSRFLENTLFEEGKAVAVVDPELGFMTLKCNPSNYYNVYQLPTQIIATSTGYLREYNLEDVVIIRNNEIELPTTSTIQLFSYDLYQIQQTINININAQKTPVIIQGSERQQLTLRNLYMKYSGGEPFIFGDKGLDLNEALKVHDLKATYLADKLTIQKHETWNECLTFLGINNSNTDKKERLITNEVDSNNELISYYLNCFYKTRKQACDEINKKWNYNIKIKINNDVKEMFNIEEMEESNNE